MPYNNSRGRSSFGGPRSFGGGAPSASYNGRSMGPAPRRGARKKENIHPSKFIKAARSVEVVEYVPVNKFSDFAVTPLLHENIIKKGFVIPSPIQDEAIPQGLLGHDVIGIANTGTGKTVAFAVPMLDKLIANPASSALIMAPTRELALQIQEECKMLARGSGLMGALLIGGAPMMPQLRDLKNKPSVVIGTPGRIKDHLERGSLDLSKFDIVVLDEVDRMLDMGFVNDMRIILARLAEKRQSYFFSATMDPKVRTLINDFSVDPVMISVKTGDTTDNVEQNVVVYTPGGEKIEKLHDILMSGTAPKVLIFDDTQRAVERLSEVLQDRGFKADSIHGGKSQGQRQRALDKFKSNQTNILVATDVAARGIDIKDISHVINYSTPQSYSDYVHRIGRAGRAGNTGNALTFIEK